MGGVARFIIGVVVVLAVVWLGLWWVTELRLQDMLADEAKAHTASDGSSTMQYDSITKGFNPLVAEATIINPHLSLSTGQAVPITIAAAQARVWISAFSPLVMHVDLPDRILVTTPKLAGSINFGSIGESMTLDPRALFDRKIYAVTSAAMTFQNADVMVGDTGVALLHIDDFSMQEALDPTAGPQQSAITMEEGIDGIAMSPTITALLHVPFGGKVTHFGFAMALSGPADWRGLVSRLRESALSEAQKRQMLVQAVHRWAEHGGNAQANLNLMLGPSTLTASGTVAFDAKAQPSGTADLTADHLDAFTAALTGAYPNLQQNIAMIETELSPYLSTSGMSGQELKLHVAYGKDGVMVNGTRKADLPPIDWDALATLANPPAAAGNDAGAGTPPAAAP